ncbi:dihydrolipoyl dehydrogenase [Alkalicoccus urumqiensis]|uniref:Dihydrolipoyl dehydrogenase n=1 Tax=Alkalicoccus urumqiensis TaxID=1548213 RepID=A0A2P6MKE9_ALKUR|nr:dihydrolipoyl dehydrogenase [Alkalicoccus urumqiensis]PRO66725.1 dihydrolipoyl dehydrogenase [Alkalicoccus urumqiensis]
MAEKYDLVILGAGTGGYTAAVHAAKLGMKTAVVEKGKTGGTCLHRGCIPSKAMLRSAEVYRQTKDAEQFGVTAENTSLDFRQVQKRKEEIVSRLHQGVESLMGHKNIDVYKGTGRILGPSIFSPVPGTISVEYEEDKENDMLLPDNVLIACGGSPNMLPGLIPDEDLILTSEGALGLKELPSSITIIGGGAIGVEWASMLVDFDVDVTLLESAPGILPQEDKRVGEEMKRCLTSRGVKIHTSVQVKAEEITKENGVTVPFDTENGSESVHAEKLLVSIGRKANLTNIGIENTSIVIKDGFVEVNEWGQTKDRHIYASGDITGGLQLAHAASAEGITAVNHMAGNEPFPVKQNLIPRCIYSFPEAASIGLTEEQAEKAGYSVKTGHFPFKHNGKALVYGEEDGFVRFIADEKTDDLLGVHMIGPHVTELISEASLAMLLDAAHFEVAQTIHPHPALSEASAEAAAAVSGRQIHG